MTIIQVNCIDQVLTITNSPVIASGGVNEDFVQFSFDSHWDGFGKLAMFYRYEEEATVYESAIDSDGLCEIPHEVISAHGKLCFGVTGVNGDDVRTSEILVYDIEKGSPRSGQTSEPAPTSVYNQMLAIAEEINETASQIDSQVAAVQSAINAHADNSTIHVTSADKSNWNALENKMSYSEIDELTFTSVYAFGYTFADDGNAEGYATGLVVDIPLPKPLDISLKGKSAYIVNPHVARVGGRSVKGNISNFDKTIVNIDGSFSVSTIYPHALRVHYTTPGGQKLVPSDAVFDGQYNIPEHTVVVVEFQNLKISFVSG